MAMNRELKITIVGDASKLRQAAAQAKADLESAANAAKKIDESVAKAEKSTSAEAKSAHTAKTELEGAANAAKKNADATQASATSAERLRVVARAVKAEAGGIADASQLMRANFGAIAASVQQIQAAAARAAADLEKVARNTSKGGSASPEEGGTGRKEALKKGLGYAAVGAVGLTGLNKQVFGDLRRQDEAMLEAGAAMAAARERIRTLAGIKGKGFSSEEDIANVLDLQRETGLTLEQAVKFEEGMLNEGITSIGNTISAPEFAKYRKKAAKYLQTKALDPGAFEEASNLAGKTLRFRDYTKPGTGADMAVADLVTMFDVLNMGSGSIPVLLRELGQASGYLNENEKRGYVQDPGVFAMTTSMGAQFAPGQAGTYIRQAIRALTKFEGPQGETLKEAKITGNDSLLQAMTKMKAYLEKTAVAQGIKPSFYLQQHGFHDQEAREAIVNYMTAMDSSMVKEQRKIVEKPRLQAAAKADEEFKAFQQSTEGQALIAKQAAETQKLVAGKAFEAGLPFIQQADMAVQVERMTKGDSTAGVLSRGAWNLLTAVTNFAGFDIPGADEVESRWKQAEMLTAEANRLGVRAPEFSALDYRAESATWTRMMSSAAESLRQAAAALNKTPTAPTVGATVPPPIGAAPAVTGPVQ